MDHCQHPGKEPEGSCEDAPSSNDSGAQIARFPSDRMSEHRLFLHHESQAANSDLQPSLATLEFWLPEAQPSAPGDRARDQGLKIFGLLKLLPELNFPELLLHFVAGCSSEGIKEDHNNCCQAQAQCRKIIRGN